ncbi:AI-2E family transporter [Caulobacter sp. KR2-114]|uniref:AI-2E family transporter n=1 Tax=Caulobacter sp. KR2-114 TaxID=3400912 RepID=UPI003C0F2899
MEPEAEAEAEGGSAATGGTGLAKGLGAFVVRSLIVVALVVLALALWRLRDVLSIAFGSVMLSVGFSGLADAIARRTRLSRAWSLALVVAVALGGMGLAVEVFGAMMAAQYDELAQKLPRSLQSITAWLNASPLGREVVGMSDNALKSAAAGPAPRMLARFVAGAGQALTYALVMIAGGVFLAIDPERYRQGVLVLVPRARRARAAQVLDSLAQGLRLWLLGRLVVMAAVGVLASLGLWAMGIDAPFALGLTGAVLTFIPYVGAIMAALPGMLIGFLQEPIKAVVVAVLFWAVHFVEGTFITPLVQDEVVDVPPVISIFSTVVFAVLLGPVGVFLAAPITVVVILLVHLLYIEDVLGEPAPVRRRRGRRLAWPRLLRRRGV